MHPWLEDWNHTTKGTILEAVSQIKQTSLLANHNSPFAYTYVPIPKSIIFSLCNHSTSSINLVAMTGVPSLTAPTFHALADNATSQLIFASFAPPYLRLLHSVHAYQADARLPVLVKGGTYSFRLLSLLLTIPTTTAEINGSEFHLRCTDQSGVTIHLTLKCKPIPAAPLLGHLHNTLISAVACLEGALLENANIQPVDHPTPCKASLEYLQAPLMTADQTVYGMPSFRRVAASDMRIQAARALVTAAEAGRVRKDILDKKRERRELEAKRRKRERERVRMARDMVNVRAGVKTRMSLFDTETRVVTDVPAEQANVGSEDAMDVIEKVEAPVETKAPVPITQPTTPPKRKKKRKVRRLV